MAPFKLKFRMGSSRSTSQDTDNSDHSTGGGTGAAISGRGENTIHGIAAGTLANNTLRSDSAGGGGDGHLQPLLQANHRHRLHSSGTLSLADSSTTLNSDYTSLSSVNASDQRNLLPLTSAPSRSTSHSRIGTGYTNQTVEANLDELLSNVPQSPPPSYEFVLEETRLANLDIDNNPTSRPRSSASVHVVENSLHESVLSGSINNNNNNAGGGVVFAFGNTNMANNPSQEDLLSCDADGSSDALFTNENTASLNDEDGREVGDTGRTNDNDTNTATSNNSSNAACSFDTTASSGNCGESTATASGGGNGDGDGSSCHGDPLVRSHYGTINNNEGSFSDSDIDDYLANEDNEDDWNSHHEYGQRNSAEQMMDEMAATPDTIISNKSSKEIYKAMAKEWGVTCKMSEHCRCMECQSGYFDCAYEENEHNKTDGGLAAGTPLFLTEVLHGSPCSIL